MTRTHKVRRETRLVLDACFHYLNHLPQSDTLQVSGAFSTPACHEVEMELLVNTGPYSALPTSLLKSLLGLKGSLVAWLTSGERAEVDT